MAIRIATYDGDDLPLGFRYKPYVPKKRISSTATANAVITQGAAPDVIVHGADVFTWSIKGAFPTEYQYFLGKYDTTNIALVNFVGYWGETLEIFFARLDPPTVKGGLFDFQGAFQVVTVVSGFSATCISA